MIKLNDRGSFQTVGLVTDVEPFLRVLVDELTALENAAKSGGGDERAMGRRVAL